MMLDIFIPASPVTIFRRSISRFSGVKRIVAIGASKSTAAITKLGCRGAWHKRNAAPSALDSIGTIWNPAAINQVRVFTPKQIIRSRVTSGAERHQIIESVCLFVMLKQMIGSYMVNVQRNIRDAAILASVIVSLKSRLALLFPIWSSILSMSTKPSGIILAAPGIRRSPFCPTLPIAKIMIINNAWLPFYILTASIALYNNSLSSYSKPCHTLMHPITSRATKMSFIFPVLLYLEFLIAYFTDYFFHRDIIPRMDDYSKRTLCK